VVAQQFSPQFLSFLAHEVVHSAIECMQAKPVLTAIFCLFSLLRQQGVLFI